QENRSLTNSGTLVPQAKAGGADPFATPPAAQDSSPEDEAAEMQEKAILQENTIKQLTQSLANANAEAETYKRQAADLSLKLQTLGLDRDESEIEQRLLSA